MLPSLFHYRDYRDFLTGQIGAMPNGGRGGRTALAKAINCQLPFVTHVLNGDNHLSLEQAEAAARFFSLNSNETEFFLLLVNYNRAGTLELKKVLENLLEERAKKNKLLKNELKIQDTLSAEDQLKYYSNWIYVAVHMALTIPSLQSQEAISKHFSLSKSVVAEILDFLTSRGFASKQGIQYKPSRTVIHLEKAAPALLNHHANWRHKAVASLIQEKENDLHYSGVMSCSKKDFPKVRAAIAKALAESIEIVKPSSEEVLLGMCLDVFEI